MTQIEPDRMSAHSIHRCMEEKESLNRQRIETHRFSTYTPELNLEEYVLSYLKNRELANFCPSDEGEMKIGLRRAIVRMLRKPQLIKRLMLGSPLFMGNSNAKRNKYSIHLKCMKPKKFLD